MAKVKRRLSYIPFNTTTNILTVVSFLDENSVNKNDRSNVEENIGLQWLSELQLVNENDTKEIFLTFENNPFANFV